MEFVSSLAVLVDHVTYTERLEGEKTTLEQEVEELRRTDVEAKLVEGAFTLARHAIGILKSYLPGLDVRLISQCYNCDGDKTGELFDESWVAFEPFVEKLNLSVSDEEEKE